MFATDDQVEVRVHGRGGQGTVTLAALMVDAAFRSGWNVLGFPAFGTERTGAPVSAFVRLGRAPILDRGEIRHPNLVLVQDPTLVGAVDVLEGLADDGLVILNSTRIPKELLNVAVVAFPATELALRYLGIPKTSTAMLGFVAGYTDLLTIDAACAAIADRFTGDVAERNIRLARAACSGFEAGRAVA